MIVKISCLVWAGKSNISCQFCSFSTFFGFESFSPVRRRYIKHNLQNKLHRCADPGDLIKLDQLVERVDREGCYSQAFVRELKLFQAGGRGQGPTSLQGVV